VGELVIITLITAAYVYFVLVRPLLPVADTVRSVDDPASREQAPDPIAHELSKIADQISRKGPQKLDPITTLTNASAEGRTLTYHYTIARRDVDDDGLKSFVRKTAIASACKNSDMYLSMKDYGVIFRYSYMMPNANRPVVVEGTFQECQALGLTG
jgi:hypothetical protein